MQDQFDIIVIGGGIAGASVASHLSATRKVLVLEMEERPGYHSTGRSAASYEPNYGPAPILALTRASRREFDEKGCLAPRSSLFFVTEGQEQAYARLMAKQQGLREISAAAAKDLYPILRDGYARCAVLDSNTADIDVDLLHQGYLRRFKESGGSLLCGEPATAIARGPAWTVVTPHHRFSAPVIVNAAGAWGDRVAALAGVKPSGLQPKRRSIAVVDPPPGIASDGWPMVCDVAETWYSRPQSGKLLVSSADATPVDPHDAYADDMAVAEGIDRFQQATTHEVTHLSHSWGGLRSFLPDGHPLAGYDRHADGFFWLIGQGGYGIQTSPAFSRLAAALVRREAPPQDIIDVGLSLADISPGRID